MQSTQPKKSTFKNPFTAPVKTDPNNGPGPHGDNIKPKAKKPSKDSKIEKGGCDGDVTRTASSVKKKSKKTETHEQSKNAVNMVSTSDKKETKKKKKSVKNNDTVNNNSTNETLTKPITYIEHQDSKGDSCSVSKQEIQTEDVERKTTDTNGKEQDPGSTCDNVVTESTGDAEMVVESTEKAEPSAVESDHNLEEELNIDDPGMGHNITGEKEVKEAASGAIKKSTLPVRTLTEGEYDEIFQGAINRALNTPLDDIFRELQKEPKQVKASKLKAKPALSVDALAEAQKSKKHKIPEKEGNLQIQKSKKAKPILLVDAVADKKKPKKHKIPAKEERLQKLKPKKAKISYGSEFDKTETKDDFAQKETNISDSVVSTEVNLTKYENKDNAEMETESTYEVSSEKDANKQNLMEEEERTQLAIQQMNEISPEGSEHDNVSSDTKIKQMSPPPKKKKKSVCPPKKKEQKLEPTKLPFSVKLKGKKDVQKPRQKVKRVQKELPACKLAFSAPHTDSVKSPVGSKKQSKKNIMLNRDIISYGTWVQCCDKTCSKWRYLADIDDPSVLPEVWYCYMSNDVDHNSCEIPEEEYDESEHIFTTFSEGSIVWAKMAGFPWWPAMIEMDPDSEYFFIMESSESMHPSHYHVVFFDDKVSRAWVRTSCIEPFIGKENLGSMLNKKFQKHEKGPSFKKEVEAAKQKALQALELTPKERIQQYSFSVRYKGKWGSTSTKSQKEEKKKLKKPAKKKYCNVGKAPRVEVLNDTTVDNLLNNPDCSVLRKLEDALDSMDSDLLTEESDKWELDDDMDDDWGMSENKDLSIQLSPVVSKPVSISRGERMKNRNNKRKSISSAESSSDYSSSEDEDGEEAETKSSAKRLKKGGKKNKKITPREEQQSKSNEISSSDEEFEEAEEMKFDPAIFTMEIDSEEEKATNTNLPEDLIELQNGKIEKVIENIKVEDVVEVQNEMLNHMLNQAEEIICDALISNVRDEIGDLENNGSICTGEKRKDDLTNNSSNDVIIRKGKESGIVESDEAKENIKKKKEPKKKNKEKRESKQEDVNTPDKVIDSIDHVVPKPISGDEVSASNGKATKKDKKSGKKTFKAPETKDSPDVQKPPYEEKEVPKDNLNQAKASSDTQNPSNEEKDTPQCNTKSPKMADTAEVLGMTNLDVQGASLVPGSEQRVPDEDLVENLPHDDDVSLDIDVDPLHKHDSQGGMDMHNEMIAAGIQDDDDDSDPFEMIEE